ncbi:MAG: DNA double-strand break repair nuclease NurA [Candidatus Obscuribacterales bacterium]
MLDFTKVVQQIDSISRDSFIDTDAVQETIDNALAALDRAIRSPAEFTTRLDENAGWVLWPVATPLEDIGVKHSLPVADDAYTVVAVDGSQIMPSHHEVHSCYLLNVGMALISYGAKLPPRLETVPKLYSRPEDLYPLVDRRRLHIDELYVSLERTIMELEILTTACLEAKERGLPVLALYDGSLLPWSVEKLPDGYQHTYIRRMSEALSTLEHNRIPIIGYLSHSRGADIVNCLRVLICPYETSQCREHCGDLNEEDFPCSKVWPLSDRVLFKPHLNLNERSAVFLSGASVSKLLPREHRNCFSYLNVGEEIARLEFPRWLIGQDEQLHAAMSMILSQCQKGMGYPISLAESHHLAVIKGTDRDQFFELITRHLLTLGVSQIKTSPKQSKKRWGFV